MNCPLPTPASLGEVFSFCFFHQDSWFCHSKLKWPLKAPRGKPQNSLGKCVLVSKMKGLDRTFYRLHVSVLCLKPPPVCCRPLWSPARMATVPLGPHFTFHTPFSFLLPCPIFATHGDWFIKLAVATLCMHSNIHSFHLLRAYLVPGEVFHILFPILLTHV